MEQGIFKAALTMIFYGVVLWGSSVLLVGQKPDILVLIGIFIGFSREYVDAGIQSLTNKICSS